jgi:hypothetical protein
LHEYLIMLQKVWRILPWNVNRAASKRLEWTGTVANDNRR